MDVIFDLQAFDCNKQQGFPRKARKFHFIDPFIKNTLIRWLRAEGYSGLVQNESFMVESVVASHCYRQAPCYYFKGNGEIDVIYLKQGNIYAVEVKWANQLRPADIKCLKQFYNRIIVTKETTKGVFDSVESDPVVNYLLKASN